MEYYFTAQKLAVGYDNRPLIENIDFSLKRGEILTLIGPNGAGKSTILKSIARQLSLVSGTIYLDKSDVVTMNGNEFAKKMAVVLTDPAASGRPTLRFSFGTSSRGRFL